jgi:hypothetical protein
VTNANPKNRNCAARCRSADTLAGIKIMALVMAN